MKVKRERWTQKQVDDFREWHHELIERLYKADLKLRKELGRAREKFLLGIGPKG